MSAGIDLASSSVPPRGPGPVLPGRLRRLAALGVDPRDSEDVRLRKATLTLAATLMATMAIVWVATYWSLGLWRSGAIPFGYQLATVGGLVVFDRTKRFGPFCTSQLVMML